MQLADELISGLGNEVSRYVFFLWLDPRRSSASDRDLDALLAAKLANRRALRAARRLAERMAECVADSLLDTLEGHDAAEPVQIKAAQTAARSLENTAIPAHVLAAPRLDGHALRNLVLAQNLAAPRTLAEAESALYQGFVDEACEYIAALAAIMPSVADHALADVLKHEDEIIRRADTVLEEIRRSRQAAQGQEDEVSRFEAEYMRAVLVELGRVLLFDLDVPAISQPERLSVDFRTVSMKRRVLDKRVGKPRASDPLDDEELEPVPVPRALQTGSRLLIRGPAGSGKTTLLGWVAVTAAARGFAGELDDWNHALPFLVRAREYSDKALPGAAELAGWARVITGADWPQSAVEEWVKEQLRKGRGLVLIDGLDELPRARHGAVQDWLIELIETYDKSRFLLTSRPHSGDWDWLADHGFHDAYLQDMSPEETRAFVAHWHACVAAPGEQRPAMDADGHAAMEAQRPLARLAANPLLCALLCALDRAGLRELPTSRVALFRTYCEHLVAREAARLPVSPMIARGEPGRLDPGQALALLDDLARWMVENSLTGAWQSDVDTRIEHALGRIKGLPDGLEAAAVRAALTAHGDRLVHSRAGYIDYVHRSFQEFMAARAAVDERVFGLLVSSAHDERWRDVIVLAVGQARPEDADHVIRGLLARADSEHAIRRRLVLLAAECLDAAPAASPDLGERVARDLAGIVPPRGLDEAEILARLGDPVIEHLRYHAHREREVTQVAACVRTLAGVDSAASMEALVEYAADPRLGVFKELWRALTRTDHGDAFAERVAPAMKLVARAEEFSAYYWLADLTPFRHLPHIKRLRLRHCTAITDLSPLRALPSLQHLELVDCTRLTDLSPLAEIPTLHSLFLQGMSSLTDLSPLRALDGLQSLFLQSCDAIRDLGPLGEIHGLQFLYLWSCRNVTDLSPLRALERLAFLYLRGCPQILDRSPVEHVKTLVVA